MARETPPLPQARGLSRLDCAHGARRAAEQRAACSAPPRAVPCVPAAQDMAKTLLECDISRVVIGHTPHGDAPTLIAGEGDFKVAVLMADTS